jgi:hypothetical protein
MQVSKVITGGSGGWSGRRKAMACASLGLMPADA